MTDAAAFRIANIREQSDQSLKQRAIDRWLTDGVMPAAEATRRAEELLLVATHGAEDDVAGMATTYLGRGGRLDLPLWHMRAYVAPEFRRHEIAFRMLMEAMEYHRGEFAAGRDTRGLGVYMEIENPYIKQHRNQALWPLSGLTFIGVNARGDHCRVAYFEGARLDAAASR